MKEIINSSDNISYFKTFKRSIIGGIGWAIGVTFGFALISILIVGLFDKAGGVPLVGNWIAQVVDETLQNLQNRNPYLPNID